MLWVKMHSFLPEEESRETRVWETSMKPERTALLGDLTDRFRRSHTQTCSCSCMFAGKPYFRARLRGPRVRFKMSSQQKPKF